MVAAGPIDFGEVDLICALNKDDALGSRASPLQGGDGPRLRARHAAARGVHGRWTLGAPMRSRALASADERDVRIAQAFLRHRPITDAAELRTVRGIGAHEASAAQVRAHRDARAPARLRRASARTPRRALFERAVSEVQRAVAEVFLRSDLAAIDARALAARLQRDRVREDAFVDTVITRLDAS
jgi:hypothetical protein